MSLIEINSAAMPAPSTLTVRMEDACFSAERTLSGSAAVSRSGVKRRVEAYWAYLTPEALTQLFSAVLSAPTFTLTYPDPLLGVSRRMTAYALERSVGLYRMDQANPVWTGVRIVFMEG